MTGSPTGHERLPPPPHVLELLFHRCPRRRQVFKRVGVVILPVRLIHVLISVVLLIIITGIEEGGLPTRVVLLVADGGGRRHGELDNCSHQGQPVLNDAGDD